MGPGGGYHVCRGDYVSSFQVVDAFVPGNIQQNAPGNNFFRPIVDTVFGGPSDRQIGCHIVAVEHLAAEKEMSKTVPLGGILLMHGNGVIGCTHTVASGIEDEVKRMPIGAPRPTWRVGLEV